MHCPSVTLFKQQSYLFLYMASQVSILNTFSATSPVYPFLRRQYARPSPSINYRSNSLQWGCTASAPFQISSTTVILARTLPVKETSRATICPKLWCYGPIEFGGFRVLRQHLYRFTIRPCSYTIRSQSLSIVRSFSRCRILQ